MEATVESRKPGRPRDSGAGDAIIEATLQLLEEEGMANLSIDAIVARAGVSKPTLYRRWDSKESLVIDAVAAKIERVVFEESGDVRTDLQAVLGHLGGFLSLSKSGSVFPWLMGEVTRETELGKRYAREVILPRRTMVARLISNAVERGELRQDLDVGVAVDTFLGPVIMRKIMGPLHEAGEHWADALIDSLLDGWRAD